MLRTNGRTRAGFTLIELLVVVTIIGILASILVVAVYRAVVTATAAARKAEVKNLETALESNAISEGQGRNYPPDFTDLARVKLYLYKRFPRIAKTEVDAISGLALTPPQALVFWLRGVSIDPVYPFTGPGGPLSASPTSAFDFDQSQLRADPANSSSPHMAYFPRGSNAPFVYFVARPGANPAYVGAYDLSGQGLGIAVPYRKDNNQGFCSPSSFQIISAGADGDYGNSAAANPRYYPSGTGYAPGDADNVVNFARESTLIGDKP